MWSGWNGHDCGVQALASSPCLVSQLGILLLRTCSLAKITHSPKYLSLLFIVPRFPCANTAMHASSLCRSAHQQPQSGVTAWPTHSSPGGAHNEPILPVWTNLTERDYFKALHGFSPVSPPPYSSSLKVVNSSALIRSDG